ncbi:MAG: HAD family phosphatase [Coriobacteriaceae bacterium]|nr:HAD family phosphatase [Coriobacteriaceae bacterium]
MPIKAIALDIDGTLTNDEKRITPLTRDALLAAQERGIRVILASGRPVQGLRGLADELDLARHHGLLVACNGAVVVDAATDEVLFSQFIDVDTARAVVEHVRGFDVIAWINRGEDLLVEDPYRCMIEHRGAPKNIIKYERDACDLLVREVRDLTAAIDRPVEKILTAGTDTYLQKHWREMAAPFADELSCVFTADFYFEFTARDVHKGRALENALPHAGIDLTDLAAFGDAQNDLTMLKAAAVGVAMGNATDEVKQAADLVTLTNNEDGIAHALEQLLS